MYRLCPLNDISQYEVTAVEGVDHFAQFHEPKVFRAGVDGVMRIYTASRKNTASRNTAPSQ